MTGQQTPTGIEVVEAFMDRVNVGDLAGAVEHLALTVRVEEPASMPYGGTYHGREEFTGLLSTILGTWAKWRETPNRYAETDDGLVFRECTIRAILRSTGQEVEMPFVEMFQVRDGEITQIRPYYWDPSMLEPRNQEVPA